MTFPYKHRLLARYGSDLIELARFQRPITEHDILFWTRGVADWEVQHFLPDWRCISSRPVLKQYQRHAPSLRMVHTEIAKMEERGVQPEYRT